MRRSPFLGTSSWGRMRKKFGALGGWLGLIGGELQGCRAGSDSESGNLDTRRAQGLRSRSLLITMSAADTHSKERKDVS